MCVPLANRHNILQRFREMLTSQISSPRILLLKAESGYGKSYLIKRFKHECIGTKIQFVQIYLKNSEEGAHDVFRPLYQKLGKTYFPNYHKCLQESNLYVNVSETVTIFGETQITVNNHKLNDLQYFFFYDLANWQNLPNRDDKIVILIDKYDEALLEVKNTIFRFLETAAIPIPGLIIVIAGRDVPKYENTVWEELCSLSNSPLDSPLELHGIKDYRYWSEYAQNYQYPFGDEVIKAITILQDGYPLGITTAFKTLQREWK